MSHLRRRALGDDGARTKQARTRRFGGTRSCVRYASAFAFTVPTLAIAVVLTAARGVKVPPVALPALFTLRLVTAIVAAIALTAEAGLAHAERTTAPLADAPEELD
jgi:hypothetical protein